MFEYVDPGILGIRIIGIGSRYEKFFENIAGAAEKIINPEHYKIEFSAAISLENNELCDQEALTRKLVEDNTFLMFLLISPKNPELVEKAAFIAEAGRRADSFTIAVMCPGEEYSGSESDKNRAARLARNSWADSCIEITDDCIVTFQDIAPDLMEKTALTSYLMSTVVLQITRAACLPSMTGLDFADIAIILRGSCGVHMGIGTAHGDYKAKESVERAIASLANQGIDIAKSNGLLVILTAAYKCMSMEDYTTVNQLIHESVDDDCNIKLGIFIDNSLGDNMRVTVFTRISG
ncbi:hypothetical protein HGA64_05530 [Candidatus Falkowbacteria bacterium]|nr:hypothetical protein [Candidatus Falkowbacteria bacterium]